MTTLTIEELAERIGYPIEWCEALLADEELDGHVERTDDGWRITDDANTAFGDALRGLHKTTNDEGTD